MGGGRTSGNLESTKAKAERNRGSNVPECSGIGNDGVRRGAAPAQGARARRSTRLQRSADDLVASGRDSDLAAGGRSAVTARAPSRLAARTRIGPAQCGGDRVCTRCTPGLARPRATARRARAANPPPGAARARGPYYSRAFPARERARLANLRQHLPASTARRSRVASHYLTISRRHTLCPPAACPLRGHALAGTLGPAHDPSFLPFWPLSVSS
jgi:hypothetical protein